MLFYKTKIQISLLDTKGILYIDKSSWPLLNLGRFKILLGFKTAWPFQNLTDQSYLSHDIQ